jgi:light-regulated signal transduction histidine kinase (bacteriophytochrome)
MNSHDVSSTARQDQSRDAILSQAQLEDFTYAVAHDFKDSLRTICMFTELLAMTVALDENGRELSQFIVDGVARMGALFDGLQALAISGLDEPLKRLDLREVAAGVLQNLAHAIRVSDAVVIVDPLPFVKGNESHLQRVLQNLIANALKYHGRGQVEIRVSAERLGSEWVIRVKDNGGGVARAHQQVIFLPLKRLHGPEIPGTGVGLAICKKLVEAMGGSIWVESEPGSGATFCFTIPSAKQVCENLAVIENNQHPNGSGLNGARTSAHDASTCSHEPSTN